MAQRRVSRTAFKVSVAIAAALATLLPGTAARADSLVITFQKYVEGSRTFYLSDSFVSKAPRLWIGMRCTGGGTRTARVSLWYDGMTIFRTRTQLCDGGIYREEATEYQPNLSYRLYWELLSGPAAPSVSVYAYRLP